MTSDFIIGFAAEAIQTTLLLCLPVLGLGMVVGLAISIFQSVTQIQEMTLTFVPKIVAVMLGLLMFGPWMLSILVSYTEHIFTQFPQLVR
ncbi:MAG: flagellar biosynthesis protein FliQ [Deltaproteobacteria bacterium]|nr:flagellar biosynthesis protein FliQ [Deltaproteobacteria bacterium]